jgi:hypothetical protein
MSDVNEGSVRRFVAARKQEEFEVELNDGVVKGYYMREMNGKQREEYNHELFSRLNMGKDGKVQGMKDVRGLSTALLTRCVVDRETGKYETAAKIQEWSSTSIEDITDWARAFNALNADAEGDAKNDYEANEDSGS